MPKTILQPLLLACFLLASHFIVAQHCAGRITDSKTGESLAFVSVVESGTVNGTYSDIDGYFNIDLADANSDVIFTLIGYETITSKLEPGDAIAIRMKEKQNLLSEVVIRPGVNPAERIIRQTIENKKINNPESDIAFTYDSYNKLAFGAQVDSTIMSDTAKFAALDSSTQEAFNYLSSQYLFLMESITHRKFMPPDKSEETIIANRVSGLKTTDFFLLGTQLQSFSFYGETVDLMGVSYMSPLADNSIKKYLFILEDTTFIGHDTVFTISFQPRKGKNFDGMKGQLFINTNGYAIQNVIAEPNEHESMYIHIQQQYEYMEGRKWFPKQLNSTIFFTEFIIANAPLAGEGRSYIKNLKLDPALKKSEFTPVSLLMAPRAGQQPDSVWNAYRERELDEKELKTYQLIDSIGKEINLDRKMKGFEALTTGQLNLGPVSFDLNRLLAFNAYEKWRIGGGLHTSNLLSEKFSIGGYYAYGFGDQHSKYGGDLQVHLYRKRNMWLKAIYQNDVMELAGNQLDRPIEGLNVSNFYPYFVSRMDRREKKEIQFNGRLIRNVSVTAFVNQQFVRPFDTYHFLENAGENVQLYTRQYNLAETGIQLRYAPGEKLVRTNNRELRLGGRFPVFFLKFTRGFDDVLDGNYAYSRLDFRVDKTFRINNVGQFSVAAICGYVPDNVPLSLLYNARGSWDTFTIAAPQTFETMRTNEFQHSQFVAMHFRHNFGHLLLKTKRFAPNFVIVHNMLWGKMDFTSSHSYAIETADKGYTESGIQIDNLMVSSFSGLGLGVFYRYGAYHLPDMRDNFAFKLTSSFAF